MAETPIRVMIVDDHAVVRSGLSAFLMAYDDLDFVGDASGGLDAVRKCPDIKPDVILMDLVMPEVDGSEATRLIREACPHVQVIALTSYKEEELVQGALKAGAIGYLLKNVSAEELANAIRAAYAGRPTLAPEAAEVLIRAATHKKEEADPGLTDRELGDPPGDGGRLEQPGDRQEAVREPVDGEVPRQQHPDETRRGQPHRGGVDGHPREDREMRAPRLKPRPRPRRRPAVVAVTLAVVLLALASSAAACGGGGDKPLAKVTLQLNWLHEAEFAGYYVAQAKGFYEDQGLEVTILEGGPSQPARERVMNGEATFAVTSFAEQRDLVTAGKPSVAVMAAFQIPPLTIFSLRDSNIRDPRDLVSRKVGVTTDYWRKVLEQTLTAAGVDPKEVTEVKVEVGDLQKLYDGTVDAWLGYAQDEPIRATIAGHQVNNIFPADFGIGGYEGLVIATQSTIDTSPDMVRAFVKASEDGWRYAIENPDEAAQILTTWAEDTSVDFQKLAVRAVAPLVDTPQVPIGWIDALRWQQMMGPSYDSARPGFTMQFSPATP